jgi:hypothetical protein
MIPIKFYNDVSNGKMKRFWGTCPYPIQGIMEWWNNGIPGFEMKLLTMKLIVNMTFVICSSLLFSKIHFSNIP